MRKARPSKTARKVALNILTLGAKRGMEEILPPGIVEATATLLVESGAVGATTARWSRSRKMVWVYMAFDWMMPGQFEAFAHRKAFCERQVREGIAAGARQILVLGAGYDTLAWRLASEFAGVDFFEIDHPATARLKAKGIEAMGSRPNLHLIAEDLGQHKMSAVLTANDDWDLNASTIFIAEGLLQYLPPSAVMDLFRQCNQVVGDGRIAFTYTATGENGRPDAGPWSWLVLWILKAGGEPWLWSVRPEDLGSFLHETGWTHAPEMVHETEGIGVELFHVASKKPAG